MPYASIEDRRRWLREHPNYLKDWHKKNPGKYAEYAQKRDPVRIAARNELNRAVSRGDIIRPDNCEQCGNQETLQGHHEDYSRPLEAIWLCRECHSIKHRR